MACPECLELGSSRFKKLTISPPAAERRGNKGGSEERRLAVKDGDGEEIPQNTPPPSSVSPGCLQHGSLLTVHRASISHVTSNLLGFPSSSIHSSFMPAQSCLCVCVHAWKSFLLWICMQAFRVFAVPAATALLPPNLERAHVPSRCLNGLYHLLYTEFRHKDRSNRQVCDPF